MVIGRRASATPIPIPIRQCGVVGPRVSPSRMCGTRARHFPPRLVAKIKYSCHLADAAPVSIFGGWWWWRWRRLARALPSRPHRASSPRPHPLAVTASAGGSSSDHDDGDARDGVRRAAATMCIVGDAAGQCVAVGRCARRARSGANSTTTTTTTTRATWLRVAAAARPRPRARRTAQRSWPPPPPPPQPPMRRSLLRSAADSTT